MKARPRSVEREAAALLTEFSGIGNYSPVFRIPVLGREGPDLTINELNLAVDVKSRRSIPWSVFLPLKANALIGETEDGLLVVRFDQIGELFTANSPNFPLPASKQVWDFWLHMDQWREAYRPECVSVLVLHRPGMKIRGASVVIHSQEREKLYGRQYTG